jgi:hypothetical protein
MRRAAVQPSVQPSRAATGVSVRRRLTRDAGQRWLPTPADSPRDLCKAAAPPRTRPSLRDQRATATGWDLLGRAGSSCPTEEIPSAQEHGMSTHDPTCPPRARCGGQRRSVPAYLDHEDDEGPGPFSQVRGRFVGLWRVEDSNLRSFRDGFTDRGAIATPTQVTRKIDLAVTGLGYRPPA